MAKFSVIAAVLFCLFTLSTARIRPENDEATKIKIRLPSSVFDFRPQQSESKSESAKRIVVPLIAHSFRPVNRRFPVTERSAYPFPRHFKAEPTADDLNLVNIPYGDNMLLPVNERDPLRHSIHYHHRHRHHDCKHVDSDPTASDITYGNDMLVASSENGVEGKFEGFDPRRHTGRFPHPRRHHHQGGEDSDSDSHDEDEKDKTNRLMLLRRVRGQRWEQMLKRIENHNQLQIEKREGFMNRVRDFFGQYL